MTIEFATNNDIKILKKIILLTIFKARLSMKWWSSLHITKIKINLKRGKFTMVAKNAKHVK